MLWHPTINQRMPVEIEGDFVVFLLGMRVNRIWKFQKMDSCLRCHAKNA
jgi:hypothetical protein